MMREVLCAAASVLTVLGQPVFDVASIKPGALARAGGEGSLKETIQFSPLTLTMRNVSLNTCVQWAYRIKEYQVTGPSWTGSERYDVFAKTGSAVNEEQLRQMLRTLLTERFRLEFHRDRKEMAVYALLTGKEQFPLLTGKEQLPLRAASADAASGMTLVRPGLRLAFRHQSMSQLADTLSTLTVIGRPVLDQTGIDGFYDFTLDLRELTPEDANVPGPSASSVMLEQLGLRLEARKTPLDVLVIDRAERIPIAN